MHNNSKDEMTTTLELLSNTTVTANNDQLQRSVHKMQRSTIKYNPLDRKLNKIHKKIQKTRQDTKEHLNVAKLYSDQGIQSNAICMFRFGSAADRYATQRPELTGTKSARKIDFITQYPYEIICYITQYLDQQTVADCLDVSPSWRSKLLGCSTLWKKVIINEMKIPNNGLKHKRIARILPFIYKHVEDLKITSRMHRTTTHPIELLTANCFSNLKSLTLDDYVLGHQNADLDTVYGALSSVAQTLISLELTLHLCKNKLSLGNIVSVCPNLKSMRLSCGIIADLGTEIPVTVHQTTSLTRLHLVCRGYPSLLALQALLEYSPYLQNIVLYGFFHPDPLSTLGQLCPNLEGIKMALDLPLWEEGAMNTQLIELPSSDNNSNDGSIFGTVNDYSYKAGCTGLRSLELQMVTSSKPLIYQLARSRDTLETLSLDLGYVPKEYDTRLNWQGLSYFTMSKLTTLSIDGGSLGFYDHLPTILDRVPELEALSLLGGEELIGERKDNILDAVTRLKKLSSLKLRGIDVRGPGFERLVHHYQVMAEKQHKYASNINISNKNGGYVLNSLRIIECGGFTTSLLQKVGCIKSLRLLYISWTSWFDIEQISHDDMKNFVYLIGRLPLLSELGLSGMPMTNEIAASIVTFKSLTQFTFRASCKQKVYEKILTQQGIDLLKKHIKNLYIL